jgi:hypothetical protein
MEEYLLPRQLESQLELTQFPRPHDPLGAQLRQLSLLDAHASHQRIRQSLAPIHRFIRCRQVPSWANAVNSLKMHVAFTVPASFRRGHGKVPNKKNGGLLTQSRG